MYLVRKIDEMLLKTGLFDRIFFDFTDLSRFARSFVLKGFNSLFDLSGIQLFWGYFLYIKHTNTKGNEKMFEIGGVRLNR